MIIVKIIYNVLNKFLYNVDIKKIKTFQKYSAYGLSFMHGAQDGQKFIGLVILYSSILKGTYNFESNPLANIWIIIFVAIIMFFGVSLGGKKIVENIGNNTVKLDNVKGIVSDIGTIINLFLASIIGLPVSTTHVKTMSIITLGDESTNKKNISNIFKAWVWTFPVCFALGYFISKFSIIIFKIN